MQNNFLKMLLKKKDTKLEQKMQNDNTEMQKQPQIVT